VEYKHLFGPVHSRRLGISLGVDLVQFKTCSLNCIYCECGATTSLSLERKEYVPSSEIKAELHDYLETNPHLDYITFAGSGEPTLNTSIGKILKVIKTSYPSYKTALLTNGSLLYIPQVRQEILDFDLVLPSLDAVSEDVFRKMNAPHPDLSNAKIIEGLLSFSKEYKGILWVELFIVPGYNDTPDELLRLKNVLEAIAPTRVQLNSLDRPGTCNWVVPADRKRLEEIAAYFLPLPVEIISRPKRPDELGHKDVNVTEEQVLSLIKRRPSTIEDIAVSFGVTINEAHKAIVPLIENHRITEYELYDQQFYRLG
jgi:wyosine [tRNA(Phe)-imidazoG37] synthetase (radical SAM superfamily)